jgi:hypothetical protein
VFLKKVTSYEKADERAVPCPAYMVNKEAWSNYQQKDQRTRQLKPVWEMLWEEQSEHNCNESNPFPNISTEKVKNHMRKAKENVWYEERSKNLRFPIGTIQY